MRSVASYLLRGWSAQRFLASDRASDLPKDVDNIVFPDALEDPVEGDEGAAPADAGTAVHHNGPLLRTHPLPEGSHKPGQGQLSS